MRNGYNENFYWLPKGREKKGNKFLNKVYTYLLTCI